jgi:hypothetical protein
MLSVPEIDASGDGLYDILTVPEPVVSPGQFLASVSDFILYNVLKDGEITLPLREKGSKRTFVYVVSLMRAPLDLSLLTTKVQGAVPALKFSKREVVLVPSLQISAEPENTAVTFGNICKTMDAEDTAAASPPLSVRLFST